MGQLQQMKRWDYQARKHLPHFVPADWYCKTHLENMSIIVTCPHCGTEIRYGSTFVSLEIVDCVGSGFAVCKKCHENELERWQSRSKKPKRGKKRVE